MKMERTQGASRAQIQQVTIMMVAEKDTDTALFVCLVKKGEKFVHKNQHEPGD